MRNLTDKELLMVSGAGSGMTVSPETVGGAVGGTIGGMAGGLIGGGVGVIVGGAIGNSLANGTRDPGSVSTSGIPWGASMGGPYQPVQKES
ncbi:hypothetical protein PMI36_01669 [Pseudomonas sp. GM79]|jgi:hypothetical protein|nr:hypothetical protein PMI36_01669 [Pseudomonas sp. GM79]